MATTLNISLPFAVRGSKTSVLKLSTTVQLYQGEWGEGGGGHVNTHADKPTALYSVNVVLKNADNRQRKKMHKNN